MRMVDRLFRDNRRDPRDFAGVGCRKFPNGAREAPVRWQAPASPHPRAASQPNAPAAAAPRWHCRRRPRAGPSTLPPFPACGAASTRAAAPPCCRTGRRALPGCSLPPRRCRAPTPQRPCRPTPCAPTSEDAPASAPALRPGSAGFWVLFSSSNPKIAVAI